MRIFVAAVALVAAAGCSKPEPKPNGLEPLNGTEMIRLENNGYDTSVLRNTQYDPKKP